MAGKDLERLDKPITKRIVARIQWLAENIEDTSPIPLQGDLAGLYKLREGDYRIVYEIIHKEKTILVHGIGHRREVYRRK